MCMCTRKRLWVRFGAGACKGCVCLYGVHVTVYVCVLEGVACVRVGLCVFVYWRGDVWVFGVSACEIASARACVRVCACARVRVCACARVRVCACERVRVCACARVRVYACARVCV